MEAKTDVIKSIVEWLGLLVAVTYILGFLVSSTYLSSLGMWPLELGRVRYLYTGAVFLTFLVANAAGMLLNNSLAKGIASFLDKDPPRFVPLILSERRK